MFKKLYSHLMSLFTAICVVLTSAVTVSALSPAELPSVLSKETDVVPVGEEIEFKTAVQTMNVYDISDGQTSGYKVLIKSLDALHEFVDKTGIDDEIYIKQYTQSFFETNALIITYQICPGGGDSFTLNKIVKTSDNTLNLDISFNTYDGMQTMVVSYQLGVYEVNLSDVGEITELADYTQPTLEENKFDFSFKLENPCYFTTNYDDTLSLFKEIDSNYLRVKYADKLTVIRDGKIINAKNDEGNYEYFTLKSYDILQFKNSDGIICASYVVICPGDINSDGKVSASDAREALRAAAKIGTYNYYERLAMTKDGRESLRLSASDARSLLRIASRLETAPGRRIYTYENEPYIVEDFADSCAVKWIASASDSVHVKIEQEYIPLPKPDVITEIKDGDAPHSNFIITPDQTGTYVITMTYRNPWEKGKIYEQFTFTLEVLQRAEPTTGAYE